MLTVSLIILGLIVLVLAIRFGLLGLFFDILGAIFSGGSSGGGGGSSGGSDSGSFGGGDSGGGGSSSDW